jgi:hypothetical protein
MQRSLHTFGFDVYNGILEQLLSYGATVLAQTFHGLGSQLCSRVYVNQLFRMDHSS